MFRKSLLSVLLISSFSVLTGCASIVNGTNQPVSVHTGNVSGAMCSLQNNKGRWYISSTPGTAVVSRSYNDLVINCEKPGFRHGFTQVASKTKAMAFGNAIFGGVIGAGVDIADGAAYDYPSDVLVPMRRA